MSYLPINNADRHTLISIEPTSVHGETLGEVTFYISTGAASLSMYLRVAEAREIAHRLTVEADRLDCAKNLRQQEAEEA